MLGVLGRRGRRLGKQGSWWQRWSDVLELLRLLRVLKLLLRILRVRMRRGAGRLVRWQAVRGPKGHGRRLHHGRHGALVVSLQPGGPVEAPKFVIRRKGGVR